LISFLIAIAFGYVPSVHTQVFAQYLEDVIDTDEFSQLVVESAYSIEKREETDSIPFIDEIRFHISQRHKDDPVEIERKFELVDCLLEKLELSA